MSESRKKTALIGGGVIGGGWAARFLLNGIDVNVFDPSDSAERTLNEMLSNARRAYSKLTMAPLIQPGNLLFFDSLENAVQDVDFVQESAPERLELKRSIINQIDQYTSENVLICSSTSGLKPTLLQAEMKHPARFMVGHPFNPVYLLPLVEICGGEKTSEDAKLTAAEFYREVGMKPLLLRKEIDAFIADRLQEAVWREALNSESIEPLCEPELNGGFEEVFKNGDFFEREYFYKNFLERLLSFKFQEEVFKKGGFIGKFSTLNSNQTPHDLLLILNSKIKIKQLRSPIGRNAKQRKILISLGLNKINRERTLESNPAIIGMVEKVKHLLQIEEV